MTRRKCAVCRRRIPDEKRADAKTCKDACRVELGRREAKRRAKAEKALQFFPTPTTTIESFLASRCGRSLPGGHWIDPCAGAGAIPSTVNAWRDDVRWTLVELDKRHAPALATVERVDEIVWANFVEVAPALDAAEVVIFNPPFTEALAFVEAIMAMRSQPWIVMLQRLGWGWGQARAEWIAAHAPHTAVLPERPDFTGGGGDMTEYAWHVWQPGQYDQRAASIWMLDPPPIRNTEPVTDAGSR